MRQSIARAALVLVGFLAAGCSNGDYARLYRTEPLAPSLDEAGVRGFDHLGAILIDQGANFSVFAGNAHVVELLLFDDPESERPTRRIPMERFGEVWNIYVEGVGLGQHYGYIAWGPNWVEDPEWFPGSIHGFLADVDGEGHRYNPNKLLFDPYGVALHRDHDWTKGSIASGPARTEVTWDAAAKSVIVRSEYAWSDSEARWLERRRDPDFDGHRPNDLIIYEVHPKGFTASTASAVLHPGTFRGIGEKADYLADLGITAVELMPVMEKPLDGTYWGYNNISFFAAELSYAAERENEEVIDEFKWMVDQLHQRDIEVILDVVYNHTGEGGLWRQKIAQDDVILDNNVELINHDAKEVAGLYSFRGLDNAGYYALGEDPRFFWDHTGVGNQVRCNHEPVERLIMDSLHHWVEEFHVDGFRFDLAPVLGAKDLDYNTWEASTTILQKIIDDPLLRERNVRIIAEPWSLAHFKLGDFPAAGDEPAVAWYEWNGNYRDVWRAFVNFDDRALNSNAGPLDVGATMTGSQPLFGDDGRRPYHSVNFVTAHDGFTLYDLFSYDEKRNLCGPLNPICCSDPTNPFCDPHSGEEHNRSRDWGADNEPFKRQMMRNLFVALLVSHGTPMLLGGDEWMRTQLGNNNAYSTSADNPYNWFDWGAWQADDARVRMHDFVRRLIALRKAHRYAFAPADYDSGAALAWKTAANQDMQAEDWSGRVVMQHYHDGSIGPELAILINMHPHDQVEFSLPEGRNWVRLVDTQQYFDTTESAQVQTAPRVSHNIWLDDAEPVGDSYGVPSRAIVILEARP